MEVLLFGCCGRGVGDQEAIIREDLMQEAMSGLKKRIKAVEWFRCWLVLIFHLAFWISQFEFGGGRLLRWLWWLALQLARPRIYCKAQGYSFPSRFCQYSILELILSRSHLPPRLELWPVRNGCPSRGTNSCTCG